MSFSIHDRNIQHLALEIHKVTKGLAVTGTSSLFLQFSNNRHKQSQSGFSSIGKSLFGQSSIMYLAHLIWNSITTTLRNIESFVEFKSLIKNWKPSNCPCR